jgi:signal peptidase II
MQAISRQFAVPRAARIGTLPDPLLLAHVACRGVPVRIGDRLKRRELSENPSSISLRRIWFIVLIVLLDQGTKLLAVSSLEPSQPMAVLPSVEFVLSFNKGISFSFLQFVNDAQRWPLVGLSILASGLLGWWLSRVPPGRPVLAIGLALIVGGALGNMLDRARTGSVIDFVHVSYKSWSFAVFNFADAAITMGVMATLASTYLQTPRVCPDEQGQ